MKDNTKVTDKTKIKPGLIEIEEGEIRKASRHAREFSYTYLDGIRLKRSWGGQVENFSILVVIGVHKI